MVGYGKVTEKEKEKIREMRKEGKTLVEIGEKLKISPSTVAYHSSEEQRQVAIKRSTRNRKPLNKEQKENKKKYTRKYHARRYKNDEEFRNRIIASVRRNQKKNGKQ